MKTTIIAISLLAAAGLAAQPTPAKPTPSASEAATPAPAKTQIYDFWSNAKINLEVWAAGNYSFKSTFSKQVDSSLGASGSYFLPKFGVTGWYGNQTQVGFSAGFWMLYTNTATIYSQDQTASLSYIPMLVMARRYLTNEIYVGGGAGGALLLYKVTTSSSATSVGFAPLFAVRGGYDYKLTREIMISGFLDVSMLVHTINQQIGLGSAADYSATSVNFSPGISATYTL